MPLTLDATVGGASANTYADATDADDYLSYRIGASAWTGYSDDLKAQALVSATRDIDTLDFVGERATDTQALEWPRTGTDYADDVLPPDLIAATCELAFLYAQAYTAGSDPVVPTSNGNLKRKKIGPIEKEWFAPTVAVPIAVERFPASVQAFLADLIREETVTWGSAAVVRGS